MPAVAFERHPKAAIAVLPSGYRRREPEKSVLHGIVREHLEAFLAEAAHPEGGGYPRFVEREFLRFLDCGLLCNGFARLRCPQCGFERFVAFSCKGKLWPSCLNRRAADTAAWLVDRLLPEAGYRQWVLTFPWTLRFEPLPPPTTADVEQLTATIARRLMERVATAWETDGSDYLAPDLAALCEAFLISRTPVPPINGIPV